MIAEAHDGAREMLFLAGIIEGAAHREHGLRERAGADFGAASDRSDPFVATDGAVAVLDEIDDRVERARRHRDECAAAPQFAACGNQLEIGESVAAVDRADMRVAPARRRSLRGRTIGA